MCRSIASQVWDGDKVRVFVTLTFAEVVHDGRKQLARLRERWVRRWGVPHAVWWREFQGPPDQRAHYHLLVEMTAAEAVLLRGWLGAAWKGCGGGFVDVRLWSGPAKSLYVYAMKEVGGDAKEYQHELPVALSTEKIVEVVDEQTGELKLVAAGLGRWWGVWGCKASWDCWRVTRGEFMELRRRARRAGVPLGSLRSRHVCSWWAVAPPGLCRGLGLKYERGARR